MARHGASANWAGRVTEEERANESHTEFAQRMLNSKPHATLADTISGGAAAAGGNIFEQSQASRGPSTGKVISVTRPEVFGPGTGTRTVMKVLLARGGERTVTADAQGGNTRIAAEIMEGDTVKLQQSGPTHWEWVKVVPVGEKVRKKRRVFDLDALLGPEGLQKVHEQFHRIRWDTRPACESKALTQIVSLYKEWAFALWPKSSFPMLVSTVERLGTKAVVKELVTDIRYGQPVDWESYRNGETEGDKRRAALKANLSANAAAVFNDYAAQLQPGIRRAKGEEGEEGMDGQQQGLIDEDDINDDEFDALLGSINGTAGGAAAAAFSAGGKPATAASATAVYAANKAAREAESERRRNAAAGNTDAADGAPAAANAWTVVASKVAAAAKSAAASAAQLEEDLAASAAIAAARAGTASGHKRRRALLDDSDDEAEADFAPLPAPSQTAEASAAAASAADAEPSTPSAAAAGAAVDPSASGVEGAIETSAGAAFAAAGAERVEVGTQDLLPSESQAAAAADVSVPPPSSLSQLQLPVSSADVSAMDESEEGRPSAASDAAEAQGAVEGELPQQQQQPQQEASAAVTAVAGEPDVAAPAVESEAPAGESSYTGGVELEADEDALAAFLEDDAEGGTTSSQQRVFELSQQPEQPQTETNAQPPSDAAAPPSGSVDETAPTLPMDTNAGGDTQAATLPLASVEPTQVL